MTGDLPPPHQPLPAYERERSFTKIVATIGPASEDRVGELIEAGMSVARVNFSHGTLDDHRRLIGKVRAAARERLMPVGILGDLPGPKMRTGSFPGGALELPEGERVQLRSGDGLARAGEVLIDVPDLQAVVLPDHRIALADGQVELVAEEVRGGEVGARVRRAGTVGDRQGVHLPDSGVCYELPTSEDRELIAFAVQQELDFLGVSFVGKASEVVSVRELAGGMGVIAKIERAAALENLAELIEVSEGIMVARGDLGVELRLAELPIAQKSMIRQAVEAGKLVITATEMLESMVHSSRPTRAEVTDVANAVLDGTDALMLSAETAVGEYPVEAVSTMREIAREVECSDLYDTRPRLELGPADATFKDSIAMAAVHAARALKLSKIICFTETGNTVRLISRSRPSSEIIALSPNLGTVRQMTCMAHVRPIQFRREPSLEDMLYMAAEILVVRGLVDYGEEVVFVAGVPPGVADSTNVVKLHRIGDEVKFS